jgi:hypothetical protein
MTDRTNPSQLRLPAAAAAMLVPWTRPAPDLTPPAQAPPAHRREAVVTHGRLSGYARS